MFFALIDINISIQLKQMRRSVREKHFHSIENNRALATFRAGDSAEMSEPMPAHSSRGSRTSPAPMTDSPSMREPAESHFPKRTSAFIHAGAAHFHIQKMGKLQKYRISKARPTPRPHGRERLIHSVYEAWNVIRPFPQIATLVAPKADTRGETFRHSIPSQDVRTGGR